MTLASRLKLALGRLAASWRPPQDFSTEELATLRAVGPYTMTSPERVVGLIRAVEYLVRNRIAGDFVECGVWKGGSIMAVARTLRACGDLDRRLWLYDTFAGMTAPGEVDRDWADVPAAQMLSDARVRCEAALEEVRRNVASTGYPAENLEFVVGRVEDTLPARAPGTIALLRLDTDWYESTKRELECLFPRLVRGGVLILDDYGHWRGARRAVDEFLREHGVALLLNRLDYSGRIAVKV